MFNFNFTKLKWGTKIVFKLGSSVFFKRTNTFWKNFLQKIKKVSCENKTSNNFNWIFCLKVENKQQKGRTVLEWIENHLYTYISIWLLERDFNLATIWHTYFKCIFVRGIFFYNYNNSQIIFFFLIRLMVYIMRTSLWKQRIQIN